MHLMQLEHFQDFEQNLEENKEKSYRRREN